MYSLPLGADEVKEDKNSNETGSPSVPMTALSENQKQTDNDVRILT